MAKKCPDAWKYTSYSFYAYGESNPLIDPPKIYLDLGFTPKERQETYRHMAEAILAKASSDHELHFLKSMVGDPFFVIGNSGRI